MPRVIRSEYGRDVEKLYCDGARLGFKFRYSSTLVEHIKVIKKEHHVGWEPSLKLWWLPLKDANDFLNVLARKQAWDLAYLEALKNAIEVAEIDRADAGFCTAKLKVRLLRTLQGGTVVNFDFDWVLVEYMHELGARFSSALNKSWVVEESSEDVAMAMIERCGLEEEQVLLDSRVVSLSDAAEAMRTQQGFLDVGSCLFPSDVDTDNEEPQDAVSFLALTAPMEAMPVDEVLLAKIAKSCDMFPYQVDGSRHLLRFNSALLADDMGLGKTRQSIVAAIIGAKNRLVVCPASLKENWKNEIEKVDLLANVQVVNSKSDEILDDNDWIIINYELTDVVAPKVLERMGVLIVDEAHYLKEASTMRTQNVFMLASQVPRRILLTGTPLLNRESEIYTLLRLSGHPIGEMSLKDFNEKFTDNPEARQLLNERIQQWMLRRVKNDVMKELPPKLYQKPVVTPPEDIWQQYSGYYDNDELMALEKIVKLRVCLERMKLPFILNEMRSLPEGKKAIIFCEYLSSVKHLKDILEGLGIHCVTLTGQSTQRQRNRSVQDFQDDDSGVRVFIATTKAGGVGLNLTAAEYVYFASLPWTPSELKQAEDRAHRRGQNGQVYIVQPVVLDTIDTDIRRLLDKKEAVSAEILQASMV